MNKDKKIERLQQRLDEARKEAKAAKKEASKAKREIEKLKKKDRQGQGEPEADTISLESVKRHVYSGFIITLSLMLVVYAGCSPYQAERVLKVLNRMLKGVFKESPVHTTIRTWLAKAGLDKLTHPYKDMETAYAMIMDASISVGDQQLLVALKVPADYAGHALTHSDTEVVGMKVGKSWTADKVKDFVDNVVSTQGHDPDYAISDNGANLKKAMELLDFRHHRDIGHTFATFVRKVYEKDPEYVNLSGLIGKTKHLALSDMAYLMPCKQRSIARFMNLYPVIDWSKSILDNYHRLNDKERYHFSFIPRNASLINELDENLDCIESIMTICKNEGFSIAAVARGRDLIKRCMMPGSARSRQLAQLLLQYLDKEAGLLFDEHSTHNISSDIIESLFGSLKECMPTCQIAGFTESVLRMPLLSMFSDIEDETDYTPVVKCMMERSSIGNVIDWKKQNLLPNLLVERRKRLA